MTHRYNASDPVNLALNYAYGVLEGECRKAINSVGLEPSVGFLHEFADYQTKQSLVYGLQEPFRWVGDVTVIEAFESGLLDIKDFYFTGDNYRYHLEIEPKRRFLELLKTKFNSEVEYKGKMCKWDTLIVNKTQELGRFLLGRLESLSFTDPYPNLTRYDNIEIRKRILELTQKQAKEMGIGKSTLCYLRKHARDEGLFRIYQKVVTKIQ